MFRSIAARVALADVDPPTRAVVAVAVGCAGVQALQPAPPLSIVTSVVLLLLAPGFVVARSAHLDDPLLLLVVTVAASMALDVLMATLLLYLRVWSVPAFALSMGLVTVVAAIPAALGAQRGGAT
jgi:hypothetical protein